MKKWLFFVLAGLLFACDNNDDDDDECRFLSITQTTEESSSSFSERIYKYEGEKLSSLTINQPSVANVPQVIFDIATSATSHTYKCYWNGRNYSNYYNVTYSVNTLPLATKASYVYQEGEPRSYEMEYITIDGKYYLSSITEFIQNVSYYVLTFDYSRFELGEIGLTQTLLGKDRFYATITITHDNKAGIPDVHLNDADFHPLDKHFEAIYGGLLGTFDYFISKIEKETQTTIANTTYTRTEAITSSIKLNANGYPEKITSVSDNKSKKTKYYEFGYK